MHRLAVAALLIAACSKPSAPPDPRWEAGLQKFREGRARSIGGPDGWITLVARVPLKKGANSIGSDPNAQAMLPADRSPAQLGTIVVEADSLFFTAAPGAEVKISGAPVTTAQLQDDSKGKPTVLEAGSLRLHVLKRGSQFMLRVKDREHPARAAFKGLEWFPPDPALRLKARLEPSPPGTTIPILNVLNQTENQPMPGHLVFTINGTEYRLAAIQEDEPGFFIIFKDSTAGSSTYPAGRFINTAPADADGNVELDFNRAYSPPCAFTSFATCPLPPRENHLAVKIEAGERYSGHH